MSFLVVSHRHELIPFAYRLKLQGSPTQLVVCTPKYEKTWEGKFDRIVPAREIQKGNPTEHLEQALEMARSGEVTVLSNNRQTSEMFADVEAFYGVLQPEEFKRPAGLLRLGAWWDGSGARNPHLLVGDVGVWPGGFGPAELGGMTLIRVDGEAEQGAFRQFVAPVTQLLATKYPFRGLFQVGVLENPRGGFDVTGAEFGWPFLQSHAFLSELESFSSLLGGEAQELPRKAVTVVPLSIPPWPTQSRRIQAHGNLPITGLTPKQMGQVFWHDVKLDLTRREVMSGGTDGLLGVARGAAGRHSLARQRALELAGALKVHEKQVRLDAGGVVEAVLAQLEARLDFHL